MSFLTQQPPQQYLHQYGQYQIPFLNQNGYPANMIYNGNPPGYLPSNFKQFYDERSYMPRIVDQTGENYAYNYPGYYNYQPHNPVNPLPNNNNNNEGNNKSENPQFPLNNTYMPPIQPPMSQPAYYYPQPHIDQFGQISYPFAPYPYYAKQVKYLVPCFFPPIQLKNRLFSIKDEFTAATTTTTATTTSSAASTTE